MDDLANYEDDTHARLNPFVKSMAQSKATKTAATNTTHPEVKRPSVEKTVHINKLKIYRAREELELPSASLVPDPVELTDNSSYESDGENDPLSSLRGLTQADHLLGYLSEQEAELQRQRQEQEAELQRQREEQETELQRQRQEQEAELQRQREEQETELQRQRQEQEAELQRQHQEQETDLQRRREVERLEILAQEHQLKRQQEEDGVGITLRLEQDRSDTGLEFPLLELELESLHLSQRHEAEANLPVCFKPTDCIKMMPPFLEAEVDSFFVSIEALATQLQ
ncbi:ensconsin-like [Procambarus clarkii]|uniref:ensconsin-like n=1 Tax=Procambarus clarkii TaxID=6728 RepID=UPI003742849A